MLPEQLIEFAPWFTKRFTDCLNEKDLAAQLAPTVYQDSLKSWHFIQVVWERDHRVFSLKSRSVTVQGAGQPMEMLIKGSRR